MNRADTPSTDVYIDNVVFNFETYVGVVLTDEQKRKACTYLRGILRVEKDSAFDVCIQLVKSPLHIGMYIKPEDRDKAAAAFEIVRLVTNVQQRDDDDAART